jgi:hypothetical protein
MNQKKTKMKIITSLILTAIFTLLSDYIFNEDSPYCIVPEKYRILNKLIDTNENGEVSEVELNEAISILEKAKKQKHQQDQKKTFLTFNQNLQ